MPEEAAVYALAVIFILSAFGAKILDRVMPPAHIPQQIELLKSIDGRLEKMNGVQAKTLDLIEQNADLGPDGIPRWWCHWPFYKKELINTMKEFAQHRDCRSAEKIIKNGLEKLQKEKEV